MVAWLHGPILDGVLVWLHYRHWKHKWSLWHGVVQLQPYLDWDNLASIVHAQVTSRLDYYSAAHVGLPFNVVWKLYLV